MPRESDDKSISLSDPPSLVFYFFCFAKFEVEAEESSGGRCTQYFVRWGGFCLARDVCVSFLRVLLGVEIKFPSFEREWNKLVGILLWEWMTWGCYFGGSCAVGGEFWFVFVTGWLDAFLVTVFTKNVSITFEIEYVMSCVMGDDLELECKKLVMENEEGSFGAKMKHVLVLMIFICQFVQCYCHQGNFKLYK